MALSTVRELVQKLMADAGLKARLSHGPESVFKGYDLTPEEKSAVLSVGTRYGFETPSGTFCLKASYVWWAGPSP